MDSGIYEASSAGRNGDVKLTVAFTSSKIKRITSENEETGRLEDVAIEKLIKETEGTQSLSDVVSGQQLLPILLLRQ